MWPHHRCYGFNNAHSHEDAPVRGGGAEGHEGALCTRNATSGESTIISK